VLPSYILEPWTGRLAWDHHAARSKPEMTAGTLASKLLP